MYDKTVKTRQNYPIFIEVVE